MNNLQKEKVLKILSHLKIKAYLLRTLTGDEYIAVVYNKSGDTKPFNPYISLGDSMRIAMLMRMKLSFGDGEFFVRPTAGAVNDTCMIANTDGCTEVKQVHKIGAQIVDCAVTMIGRL